MRCFPALTGDAGEAPLQRRAATERESTRAPSTATTSRGAPAHARPRTTTVRRDGATTRTSARAVPVPSRISARLPLAVASRTTCPAPRATCMRSASTRWLPDAAAGAHAAAAKAATATTPDLRRRLGSWPMP